MVLVMITSLAACNGGTNQSASTTQPDTSAAQQTQSDNTAGGSSSTVVDSVSFGLKNASWDLSPWKNNGSSGNAIWTLLYSGLVANPGFGTPLAGMQNDMAESVVFSADNLTATVKLRDYIHDSQGNPIKAQDVVFSYQKAPQVSGVYAKIGTLLDSITATDDYTVELTTKSVTPGTWEILLSNCPVVSQSWYEGASADDLSNNPATTSAYMVKENVPGTSVTLQAVDNFWQKDELRTIYETVNARTIHFVAISENSMRVIALQNEDLDAAFVENTDYNMFSSDANFNLFQFNMTQPTTFLFNCSAGSVFNDNINLRLAILHAIDFQQVRIATTGDFGSQGHDVAPIICGDYDKAWDSQPYFDYDLNAAKDYMAQAGYDAGNSGLTLHFMCRNIGPQVAGATVIQSCLKDIGINVLIDSYDQGLFDTYTADPAQWDMVWYSANMSSGFITEAWDFYFGSRGDQGTVGFVIDPQLQQLLNAAKTSNDDAARNAFRDYELQQAYAANMFNETNILAARKEITGISYNFLFGPCVNTITVSSAF